jgi:hypothetical protein
MNTEKEQQYIGYWEERRKNGRWQYAFKHGLLLFAWPVYIMSEAFKYFAREGYVFSPTLFIQGFLVWTTMGFLAFAFIMWWTQEKRYQRIIKKEDK